MSWNIGDIRNDTLKLKSKMGLHHVVRTNPKNPPGKNTLTLVEMQQLPDFEKTDSGNEVSCIK